MVQWQINLFYPPKIAIPLKRIIIDKPSYKPPRVWGAWTSAVSSVSVSIIRRTEPRIKCGFRHILQPVVIIILVRNKKSRGILRFGTSRSIAKEN